MLIRKMALYFRKLKFKKIKVTNADISIISNNCIGGTMYNDLNLRFSSPTINLKFKNNEEFLVFIMNLEKYCKGGKLVEANLKENRKGFENAPIGLLSAEKLPTLEIHFLHYKNFDEASFKWLERCKRINYRKVFVVAEIVDENDYSLITHLTKLRYPSVIFTNKEFPFKNCFKLSFYNKYGIKDTSPLMKIVNIAGKRGYDEFDFVERIFNYDFEGDVK